jgi:hypothetical protein
MPVPWSLQGLVKQQHQPDIVTALANRIPAMALMKNTKINHDSNMRQK